MSLFIVFFSLNFIERNFFPFRSYRTENISSLLHNLFIYASILCLYFSMPYKHDSIYEDIRKIEAKNFLPMAINLTVKKTKLICPAYSFLLGISFSMVLSFFKYRKILLDLKSGMV